jgi:CBS domain containing-hemolysin-like protein
MEIIGGIFLLFLFSIPLLAIFLLLLIVVLRFLQLLCYGLAWLCSGLGKLFERRQSVTTTLVPTRESSEACVAHMYEEERATIAF